MILSNNDQNELKFNEFTKHHQNYLKKEKKELLQIHNNKLLLMRMYRFTKREKKSDGTKEK